MKRRKNKRGEVPSQMFIYILTVFIIGLMFYFGISWLGTLWDSQRSIDTAKLRTDLENAFSAIEGDYGSMQERTFYVPSGIDKVCFLDKGASEENVHLNTPLCDSADDMYDPIICDAWGSGSRNVVFQPILENPVGITDVVVDNPYYICKDTTQGRFTVRLVGQGDAVKVLD